MRTRAFRSFDLAAVALLAVVLATPLALFLTRPDRTTSEVEGRKLRTRPQPWLEARDLRSSLARLEGWFDDQFGLRDAWIRLDAQLHLWIGASPTSKALLGRDGFLFLGDEAALVNVGGLRPLTESELQEAVEHVRVRRDDLAARGIPYLLVIAPDKHGVYRDALPSRVAARPPSRTDQFVERLRHHDLPVVDLRGAVEDARSEAPTYYRTDTHWNGHGADAAQVEILRAIRRLVPDWGAALPTDRRGPEGLAFAPEGPGGGLAHLLHLADRLREPPRPVLRGTTEMCPPGVRARQRFNAKPNCRSLARQCTWHRIENPFGLRDQPPLPGGAAFETRCADAATDRTLLVFRDSFASELVPHLSAAFSRAAFVWTPARRDLVAFFTKALEPDVVIEQRVERLLFRADMGAPRPRETSGARSD